MLSSTRSRLAAAAAATALLAGAPAAAEAATFPSTSYKPLSMSQLGLPGLPGLPTGGMSCGNTQAQGQGPTGGILNTLCSVGLTFVGPQTSITSTIGPTIIAAGFVGNVVTSSGNIAVVR